MHPNFSSQQSQHSIARVLKYTSIFGGVQGLYAFMGVVRNKITAILLGRVGMGLIDNYSRTAEFVGASTNLGIAFSAVPHLSRLNAEGNEEAIAQYAALVRSWTLVAALLGIVVVVLFSPLAAQLMHNDVGAWWHFACLAPVVASATLNGGEMALLKGLGRVRNIAFLSVLTAISTFALTTLAYLFAGLQGILPALVLSAVAQWLFTLHTSHHLLPYRVQLSSWRFFLRGWRMVKLGLSYALSGFIAAGGEWLVRLILLRIVPEHSSFSGVEATGIYAAAFTLTVSYSRLLLMAMDAEYFPRLSAAVTHVEHQNLAVNRQMDVLVQLAAPSMLLLAIVAPQVVHLLYSSSFAPAAEMLHWAVPYLFFKAMAVPIAYLALAHMRSRMYLAVESSYTIFFVAFMVVGYRLWSLAGAGAALSLADAAYLFVAWAVYARTFGFSVHRATLIRCFSQALLFFLGWGALFSPQPWLHYGGSVCALLCSATFSLFFFVRGVQKH